MSSSSPLVRFTIRKPFTALQAGTWLHERPKEDVFQLLSDTFRMRREDKYKFEGFTQEGSIYRGSSAASELNNFRAFLQNATNLDMERPNNKRLLPAWWSSEELERCVEVATTNADAMVGYAVEKHDIQDFYKQGDMPMQLRMFGEALDGTMIGGQSGSQMLQARVSLENSGTV
jgi:splicing suppressor protein 51